MTSMEERLERGPGAALDLSIVAPCYNEAQGLAEFVRRVRVSCEPLALSFEIVLVNDGSTDDSWQQMSALVQREPSLVCVNLARNHGHQLALTAGLSVCAGRRILILDSDLQDPPELLPDMMRLMDEGADVVYGQRRQRAGETAFKRLTASAFYRLIERLSDTRIPRDAGDFRLISRRALDVLLAMPERPRFIRGMVSWIGFTQVPIPYNRTPRFAGQSNYTVRKMLRFALDAITSFSVRPLAWATLVGTATVVAGLATLSLGMAGWSAGNPWGPWAVLLGAIALFAGTQMIFLGILGLYLGRLCEQSRGRPLFVVEGVMRSGAASARADDPAPDDSAPRAGFRRHRRA